MTPRLDESRVVVCDEPHEPALTQMRLVIAGHGARGRLRAWEFSGEFCRAPSAERWREALGHPSRASSDSSAAAVSSMVACFFFSNPPQGSEMPMLLGPCGRPQKRRSVFSFLKRLIAGPHQVRAHTRLQVFL